MKAHFKTKSFKERAKDKMVEAMDAQKAYIAYRTVGLMALAMNDAFGIGPQRLNAILHHLDMECIDQLEWEAEELGLYNILKNLRRRNMGFLADLIEESKNEAVEKARSYGLDWDGE